VKTLGLLRHAKSNWDDLALRDFDRGLNDRGKHGAALMGRHIREHGVAFDLLLASPAARVRLTLEAARLKLPTQWDERIYMADGSDLIDLLRTADDDVQALLVAGHNPGLQQLIFDLVSSENENALFEEATEKYPTATFAVLELAIDRWADAGPAAAGWSTSPARAISIRNSDRGQSADLSGFTARPAPSKGLARCP
jgi:phosphohistidine phosphatase